MTELPRSSYAAPGDITRRWENAVLALGAAASLAQLILAGIYELYARHSQPALSAAGVGDA